MAASGKGASGKDYQLARQPLEVCLLYLASELKTGDLCVGGKFADYRTLLTWQSVSRWLPTTAGSWALRLRAEDLNLTEAAQEVDRTYPQNGQVVPRTGNRYCIVRQPDPPSLEALEPCKRDSRAQPT